MSDVQAVVINEGPPRWMRWLAIPAALLIVALVALAVDTESRTDFIDRVETEEAFNDVDATRIVLMTEDGAVELSLNGETVLGKGTDGDISVLALRPDPDGDIIGYRVTDDGTFEPVRVGESTEGATLIVPNDQGGFDLVHPDGTRTRLELGDDGLRALDENGDELALRPNANGTYDLGDGITAGEADVEIDPNDQALPEADSGGGSINWRNIIIVLLGLIGLAGTVWWFVAMRPKPTTYLPPAMAPIGTASSNGTDPWDAFEAYLAELAANPDPTQAIRLAYAYAEQGMGRLPARDPEQTPYEWYRTVAFAHADVSTALWPLTERYSSIRFGNHTATGPERDAALSELRTLAHSACS